MEGKGSSGFDFAIDARHRVWGVHLFPIMIKPAFIGSSDSACRGAGAASGFNLTWEKISAAPLFLPRGCLPCVSG